MAHPSTCQHLLSQKPRVVIVDQNQPPIASFLKLTAASSSAHDHLNGNNATGANVKSSGQFKSVNVVEHQASPSIHSSVNASKKQKSTDNCCIAAIQVDISVVGDDVNDLASFSHGLA